MYALSVTDQVGFITQKTDMSSGKNANAGIR